MTSCPTSPFDIETPECSIGRYEQVEQQRIIAASRELGYGKYKTEFVVPDMHCAGCISTIERGLNELPQVSQARANLSFKSVSVIWQPEKGKASDISNTLEHLGFDHHLTDAETKPNMMDNTNRSLLLSLAVAGFAAANIMLLSVSVWSGADAETARLFHLISGLIALPTVAFSGRPFFLSAAKALARGRLNMDVPISLAVLLALGMSIYESVSGGEEAYFDASVTLLFFLLIGRYLDQLMRQKARGAVERLSSYSAKDGVVVEANGNIAHIDLKNILAGMRLRVFAGERFPVNATILSGVTDLDRSHVTGESESVVAKTGDVIEAGTLNLTAPIDIIAKASVDESFLAEMRNMMKVAEQGRSTYIRIADRMAQIYAPAVHLLALITFIFWMSVTGGDWHTSIYTAIAVLIVTCPCALGLAVPVAHVIGANCLMQEGILMRDGTALERLTQIDHVVFDKTGTLTTGHPIVTKTFGLKYEQIPQLEALASASSHPVSKAIAAHVTCDTYPKLDQISELPGLGIEAVCNGTTLRLGKPEWVAEITSHCMAREHQGFSASFAVAGNDPTYFELEDKQRSDAREAIAKLKRFSFEIDVLSGDRPSKVSHLAKQLGIENFQSSQTPADKLNYINALQNEQKKPLMVGDGINDAPSLAAGFVSMVPASASDVGRHAADFVFTRKSLLAIPIAVDVALRTARIVKQNFGLAIAYNCIAVPLAMLGLVTPLWAAIAMSTSSILVVANSLRIGLKDWSRQSVANSQNTTRSLLAMENAA